ncbi:MAG: xylulokinase [Microvirga sp.]
MTALLGIDLGTSSVKALLVGERDNVLAEASASLAVSRPRPLWSEQDPDDWWRATEAALDRLATSRPQMLADVAGIGLSGQMLGVTLLDERDRPLRPAILWNDGRANQECRELERLVPDFAEIVGCRAMAGFPAPKLRWLRRHEPERLDQARVILLPKDVVRLRLTGETATDAADGSATLLMRTQDGVWDPPLLAASGVRREQLPRIVRSTQIAGELRPDWSLRWRLPARTPVFGGAGDNMCGAVGAGVAGPRQACISLGTSGVYVRSDSRFLPAQGGGMHTHRHAVEGLFLQNGCILSAGAALNWVALLIGETDVGGGILDEVEAAGISPSETPVFTPYLAGERTPHDNPALTAAFSGLTLSTTRLHLVQSVLEGTALALGDCHRALAVAGSAVDRVRLVGGGSRSRLWASLIASEIGTPLELPGTWAYGPALGAARLARAGLGGPLIASDTVEDIVEPRPDLADALRSKRPAFASHLALRPAAGPTVRPA